VSVIIKPRVGARFVEINAARQVRSVMEEALADQYPTLVTGEPGTGKTTALLRYVAEMRGFYCQVGHPNRTVRGLYLMLMDTFGFWHHSKFTADIAVALYSRLTPEWGEPRRLLVVDEVQALDLVALRELLNLQETCNLALVLSGNDKRLAATQSHDSALEQIKSRIGARVRLGKPFAEDCRDIAIDFNVEGRDAHAAVASFGIRTSIRDLVRLLQAAGRVATAGTIQLRHVEQAIMTVYGDPAALDLLQPQ
jgi:DNA transposition AAA+ family ATPase